MTQSKARQKTWALFLFVVAKNQKQLKCPTTAERASKPWSIHSGTLYINDKEQSTVKQYMDESCNRREDILYVPIYMKFKMGKQIYKDSNQNNLFWGG